MANDNKTKPEKQSRPGPAAQTRGAGEPADPGLTGLVLNGAYRLERKLGEGGMGAVYEAVSTRLPRRFAIKILHQSVAGNAEVVRRFYREAEIAGSLGDEHIVQAFDCNQAEAGFPYIVMELLTGEDLGQRLSRRGRLTLEQTLSVVDQLTGALDVAHVNGIVHRDLKPGNIFLCRTRRRDDFVKILDFGISKMTQALRGDVLRTQGVFIAGTPAYMSPEQAAGDPDVDARTDIFAVGAILFELLTGCRAFPGEKFAEINEARARPTPSLRAIVAELPAGVDAVVRQALELRREDRFATAGALRAAFFTACGVPVPVTDEPTRKITEDMARTLAAPPSYEPAQPPWTIPRLPGTTMAESASEVSERGGPKRARWPWLVAAGLALAVAAGSAVIYTRSSVQRTPQPPAAGASPSVPVPAPGAVPVMALPVTIALHLNVEPSGARVELDGVEVKDNPLNLPKSDRLHRLVISAPGYEPQTRELGAVMSGSVDVALAKVEQAPALPEPGAVAPVKKRRRPTKKDVGPVMRDFDK